MGLHQVLCRVLRALNGKAALLPGDTRSSKLRKSLVGPAPVCGLAGLLLLCTNRACYHVLKADTSGFLTQGSATTSIRTAGSPEASGLAYEMTRWPAHQPRSLMQVQAG